MRLNCSTPQKSKRPELDPKKSTGTIVWRNNENPGLCIVVNNPPPTSPWKKVGTEVFYPRKVTAKCLTHKRLRMSELPKGFVSYLVIPVTIIPECSLVVDHNGRWDNLWPGYPQTGASRKCNYRSLDPNELKVLRLSKRWLSWITHVNLLYHWLWHLVILCPSPWQRLAGNHMGSISLLGNVRAPQPHSTKPPTLKWNFNFLVRPKDNSRV